jgi:flagellin-specific chaperone FliS
MNPYQKYRRQTEGPPPTRIDGLLALLDKALERLNRAEEALGRGDTAAAVPQLSKAQLIASALASGVRVEVSPEVNACVLRLYALVVNELTTPSVEAIANARNALRALRAGFDKVRAEANELERNGQIAALGRLQMVHATA